MCLCSTTMCDDFTRADSNGQSLMDTFKQEMAAYMGGDVTVDVFSVQGTSSRRLSIIQSVINQSFNRSSSRDNHASTVELRAFLLILLNALKKQPHRHEMWLQFVIQILPWVERSLATIVCRVVEQLCKNMGNAMSVAYENPPTSDVVVDSPGEARDGPDAYPANYLAMTLESLTTLVHFCVIDSAPSSSSSTSAPAASGLPVMCVTAPSSTSNNSTSMVGHAMSVIPGSKVATELFSQLGKVFSLSGDSGGVISKMESSRQHENGWRQAQHAHLVTSFSGYRVD